MVDLLQGDNKENLREELLESLNTRLANEGWIRQECGVCKSIFYGTKNYKTCGSEKCGEPEVSFDGAPRHFISLVELEEKVKNFFNSKNYLIEEPLSILHSKNNGSDPKNLDDSLFTIAGVQILDDFLFHGKEFDEKKLKKLFIAQPSVRLSSISKVGYSPGFYTSFINICTESVNPSVEEYLTDFSLWLKLVEELLGLDEIRLKLREKVVEWNNKKSPTIQIFFYYKGMELGDAGFYYGFQQDGREDLTIGDIGFGLERLCICINKPKRHFDIVGPYLQSFKGENMVIDRTRTLVLLVGSNILPSDTPQGNKVRTLIKDLLIADNGTLKWYEIVPYFYAFWNDFTKLELSPAKIREILKNEVYKQKNRQLATELGIKVSNEELILPTYDFIELYINEKYGKIKSFEGLDEALKGMF